MEISTLADFSHCEIKRSSEALWLLMQTQQTPNKKVGLCFCNKPTKLQKPQGRDPKEMVVNQTPKIHYSHSSHGKRSLRSLLG